MEENKEMLPTVINFDDPKMLQTLQTTVAKGATGEEFAIFVQFCKATGLNPFKKEIWFIKTKDARLQMMTGINGFYEIANRHPQFDGLETEAVEEGGRIIKYIARCYRKDRSRPTVAEAYWSEYAKDYGNWKTMPHVMLSKCAESMALRKSFPQQLNGLYTEEEMPKEFEQEPQKPTPKPLGCLTADELAQTQEQLEARTNKAIKDGSAYEYDLARIGEACQGNGNRKKIFALLKAKGFVPSADKKKGYTFEPVPELQEYLAVNAIPQDDDKPSWLDDLPHAITPEEVVSEEEAHKKLDAMMAKKNQSIIHKGA